VIVGGVAVIAHGFVRNTRDLDLFIRPTVENAAAAHRALSALGAPLENIDPTDLLNDEEHFQLATPNGSVDILSSIGEMSFEQAWRNRIQTVVDSVPVNFISREDLIENKLQVGRLIDLADAEELQRLEKTDAAEPHFPPEDDDAESR
jgi:hypothetical protein